MRLRLNSLAARLIATAAIWTMLGLIVGGLVLSAAFRSAALSNFDDVLRNDLDGLIIAAQRADDGILLEQRFLNASYARVYSGRYFEIAPDAEGAAPLVVSRSLFGARLFPRIDSRQGALAWGEAAGPDNQNLRVLTQRVVLTGTSSADVQGDVPAFRVTVAGDMAMVDAQVDSFNDILITAFALLGAGLVIAIFLQVRIGLLPLRRVSESLSRIRDGKAQRLEGDFPKEIAPLATELNSLIAHGAEVVGRARTHVSNLAHFLKTPLAVLASEAEAAGPSPLADQVRRQVFTMRRQVDHYLTRARAAGNVNALGNRTAVEPVLADLTRVLTRMHQARGIEIETGIPANLYFRGERQDLEEMTGNLIDNACKWARSEVHVTARRAGAQLVFDIEDDGPGLSPEERQKVGTRGERLDESVPGTGLGLAIVRDIAKLYGGALTLDASPRGGLLARLSLPAIG